MGEKLSSRDREAITGMIADAAENVALRLTPPELASSPAVFQRADGSSVFRPKHATVFSSEMLVAVEDRLLDRAHALTAPTVTVETVEKISSRPDADAQRGSSHCPGARRRLRAGG